jgi:hypothetical protein
MEEIEFDIRLENEYPYLLYCIWWKTQPNYVKVGYGNKYRPCSSSYSTPFASDGNIKIWVPSINIDKQSMFSIEQQLHLFLKDTKKCKIEKDGGKEMYKLKHNIACSFIDEFLLNKQYQSFETTISQYKKKFKNKPKDYTVFASNLLFNVKAIKCLFCDRNCSKQIHECLCLCNGEQVEIYVGSTCFKKLNRTYLKQSTITSSNYLLNKISNPQFQEELEEEKQIQIINKVKKEDVIDCYIHSIELNYRPQKSYIREEDVSQIKGYLIHNICNYIFNDRKMTFTKIIDNKFIKTYNLTDIFDITTIYGLISNTKYIILGQLDTINNEFEIQFNHTKLNSIYILNYFNDYKNKNIFNYDLTTNLEEAVRLTNEQIVSLESDIPYISGFPGTGKSRICKYIIENNQDKNILIITPTYSTRESLIRDFPESKKIMAVVIASINDKKLIIKLFNPDIILIDEYGMIDIVGWYKIMNICNSFNKPKLKVFGDPYQLPPIEFQTESQLIIKQIFNISNKLTINFRSNCPEQYNYLTENKSEFNIIDIISKFDVAPYDSSTILSLFDREFNILTSTNDTVNEVNNIKYLFESNKECESCIQTVTLINSKNIGYKFCDSCIDKYEFVITSNINCSKSIYNTLEILLPKRYNLYKMLKRKADPNSKHEEKEEKEEYLYYSKDREKVFYNGELIKIKIGKGSIESKKYYDVTTSINGLIIKRVVVFNIESLFKNKINLPYAQTIHKSQGQTINKVVIIIDKNNITSSSLYTAFTRAKKLGEVKIMFKNTVANQLNISKNDFDRIIINHTEETKNENIQINENIKCTFCNRNCKLKTTITTPIRKYWGCYNKSCGGGPVKWFNDIQNDIQLQNLTEDFDYKKINNQIEFRLKDSNKRRIYKRFFEENRIRETNKNCWFINTDSNDIIISLTEHLEKFGGNNKFD